MSDLEVEYTLLKKETEHGGYLLNPDKEFVIELIEGLSKNQERYGYRSCPCRLATANKEEDLDIICPCDYRDPDLSEHGACYCALYVSKEIFEGKKEVRPVPERRPMERAKEDDTATAPTEAIGGLKYPVWRCKVCGYICARDEPPGACPVCKAEKERFELFIKAG